ncbi:TPA: hypothetical protein QCI11_004000 [Enterobacter ludwigii]|nr:MULTISPECIES: hypothetical protein [Enterobacter cloacae complex]AVO99082.1 hypothetical protein AM379_01225 [Enterobacter cloacae complex sp. FDA-CDC-AR_0132]EUM29739.1 hypothetical protein L462_02409 [Enterobacter sp. BIDMC 26]MBQ0225740.1 hypothetical protein [Enterobacter ludwigii]MCL9631045.1 hypothetical protein [Enterobacter ludwigii]MDY3574988.1 hypothetical protein [Enterobacter ludwigii]
MNVIARIINGFCSVIGVFLGLLGFLLSGVMASFVPEVAAFTALTTLLPFIIILLSVIGLYGVIKNNIKIQIAFDICLLPAWYIGTVIGGLCLLIFYISNKNSMLQNSEA